MSTSLSQLTPNRERAVALVLRYGLVTVDAVHRRVCPETTPDNAARLLDALVEGNWLRRYAATAEVPYYLLSSAAAFRLNLHRRVAVPPGYHALVRNYGMLAGCVKLGIDKFTAAEWRQQFAELCPSGARQNGYYLDHSDPARPVIGWLHVDAGQDRFRLVGKLKNEVRLRYDRGAFEHYVRAGRFLLTVITPSEGKREDLLRAFRDRFRGPTRFRVEVVESLQPLLIGDR